MVEYLNRLEEDAALGVYSMCRVRETGQVACAADVYDVDRPDLELTVMCAECRFAS